MSNRTIVVAILITGSLFLCLISCAGFLFAYFSYSTVVVSPNASASVGNAEIQVLSATVGDVPMISLKDQKPIKNQPFPFRASQVKFRIFNRSKTSKITYSSITNPSAKTAVTDNTGRKYEHVSRMSNAKMIPDGASEESVVVWPDGIVDDCIVFDNPANDATSISIRIQGENIGQSSRPIVLIIPISHFDRN